MVAGADPGIEIRRILLLTRLRDSPKGMTMDQLVNYCKKVSGWSILGKTLWDGVRLVLQSLIDDGFVAARARFILTMKGRNYLEDPLKWRMEVETREEIEQKMFWKSVYEVFDKAYARLRAASKSLRE